MKKQEKQHDASVVLKKAVLDLKGATCTSCSIAVEHIGRRLDGVSDIYVDRATSTINVTYRDDDSVLDKICDFVHQLGYDAQVRLKDIPLSE